ncbi:MAG: class I SAM-dependent methyltransferase, partial [Actinomycetota bacterium]|nr:class I SAM-dependent methyltransferase [Actinomycetota bacterium]
MEDHGPPPESERDLGHQAGAAPAPDSTYTFGDTDVEAARLALVSEIFGPTSEELLAQAVARPPALAYDLGCGPGHTTRLVAKATGATLTVGLERSEAHLVRARAGAPDGVRFVAWDVGDLPFPAGPADLAYARLLLAHLEDPVTVASSWATQLNVGGLLVIDELEWIATDHPVLQAHLHLASSLVATTGAQM